MAGTYETADREAHADRCQEKRGDDAPEIKQHQGQEGQTHAEIADLDAGRVSGVIQGDGREYMLGKYDSQSSNLRASEEWRVRVLADHDQHKKHE